jgi:hypothetical protein
MIHSTAQKRWGEVASCAYRVGVKLAEAHYAGFNEDVGCSSVPSSAGYNARKGGEGSCCGVNVWKRRHLWLGRGELSTSAAPRWRWNEFFGGAAARTTCSPEQKRRDVIVLALLDIQPPASNDDTNEARASRVHYCLRHGVPINQIWPAEGDRLFQCALTETDCHLPAPMASNTYRIIWTRAHQGSPTYTVLSG